MLSCFQEGIHCDSYESALFTHGSNLYNHYNTSAPNENVERADRKRNGPTEEFM